MNHLSEPGTFRTGTKKKILVAMSGGVDSSVAAALLKEQGHEVAGATMRTWASGKCTDIGTRACCGITGVEDARDVADQIGIPYWVLNFEEDFKKYVVDYFASEYVKGRTPNPCVACNEHIKFRLFLERARKMGYDYIATGHYAQVAYSEEKKAHYITEGADPSKDQSYVLFPLPKEVLSHLFLPIGHFKKTKIRDLAKEMKLECVMNKPDSQEICFIPSNNYRDFMKNEYVKEDMPGKILNTAGEQVGTHEGYFHYTRGQRRGLRIAHSERLYVVDTKPETNEVIVGTKEDVLGSKFTIGRMNWFLKPETNEFRAHVKIRSQHEKQPASVHVYSDQQLEIFFDEAQDAITPGQGAVIYDGPDVLGGGWIDTVG